MTDCKLCQEPMPHICDREDAAPNEFVHHGLKRLTMAIERANKLKELELLLTPGVDPALVEEGTY